MASRFPCFLNCSTEASWFPIARKSKLISKCLSYCTTLCIQAPSHWFWRYEHRWLFRWCRCGWCCRCRCRCRGRWRCWDIVRKKIFMCGKKYQIRSHKNNSILFRAKLTDFSKKVKCKLDVFLTEKKFFTGLGLCIKCWNLNHYY